jgi:hypothetical protein
LGRGDHVEQDRGGRRTTRYSKRHTTFLFTVKPFASAESPFAHLGAEWAGEPKRNEGAEWHQIGNVWPLYRRSCADPAELRSFEALAALLSIAPSPEPHPWSTGSMIPLRMACDFPGHTRRRSAYARHPERQTHLEYVQRAKVMGTVCSWRRPFTNVVDCLADIASVYCP